MVTLNPSSRLPTLRRWRQHQSYPAPPIANQIDTHRQLHHPTKLNIRLHTTNHPRTHQKNRSMPTFSRRRFTPSNLNSSNSTFTERLGSRYRASLSRHPFILFGLPFIATIVAGSFFLTPATALRYEKQDRKVQRMSQEEAMGLGKDRRKLDINEEYYVGYSPVVGFYF